MEVTLTQDVIISGRRFEAGTREMTKEQVEAARYLGTVAEPAQEPQDLKAPAKPAAKKGKAKQDEGST